MKNYDRIPKSVFAALAVSFALMCNDHGEDVFSTDLVESLLMKEWDLLHENGIVKQKPPKNKI